MISLRGGGLSGATLVTLRGRDPPYTRIGASGRGPRRVDEWNEPKDPEIVDDEFRPVRIDTANFEYGGNLFSLPDFLQEIITNPLNNRMLYDFDGLIFIESEFITI